MVEWATTTAPRRASARPPLHRTISAAAADALRRRILNGDIRAGAQLRQDALADEFGVSRIPIREALVQLEAEGLVRIIPHRGAFVAELSLEDLEELFELRALLEPRLLRRSAPLLDDADFAEAQAILDEYGAELRAERVARWGELNTSLHLLLLRHAGRPRSLALVGQLLQASDRHTRMQLALTGGMERAEREHGDIVAFCRAGDVTAATDLLRRHILNASRSLRTFLRDQRTAQAGDGGPEPRAPGASD